MLANAYFLSFVFSVVVAAVANDVRSQSVSTRAMKHDARVKVVFADVVTNLEVGNRSKRGARDDTEVFSFGDIVAHAAFVNPAASRIDHDASRIFDLVGGDIELPNTREDSDAVFVDVTYGIVANAQALEMAVSCPRLLNLDAVGRLMLWRKHNDVVDDVPVLAVARHETLNAEMNAFWRATSFGRRAANNGVSTHRDAMASRHRRAFSICPEIDAAMRGWVVNDIVGNDHVAERVVCRRTHRADGKVERFFEIVVGDPHRARVASGSARFDLHASNMIARDSNVSRALRHNGVKRFSKLWSGTYTPKGTRINLAMSRPNQVDARHVVAPVRNFERKV